MDIEEIISQTNFDGAESLSRSEAIKKAEERNKESNRHIKYHVVPLGDRFTVVMTSGEVELPPPPPPEPEPTSEPIIETE